MTRSQRKAIRKIMWKWPPKRKGFIVGNSDPLVITTRMVTYLGRFMSENDVKLFFLLDRYFDKLSPRLKDRRRKLIHHFQIEETRVEKELSKKYSAYLGKA